MWKYIALALALTAITSQATTQCNIDSHSTDHSNLVSLVSGNVQGFALGTVYITVTADGKNYTTTADRNGLWATLYTDTSGAVVNVLCWQGYPGDAHHLEATATLTP